MSCHTWYYKRVTRTQAEANACYIQAQTRWLKRMQWVRRLYLLHSTHNWQRDQYWLTTRHRFHPRHDFYGSGREYVQILWQYGQRSQFHPKTLYPWATLAILDGDIALAQRKIRMVQKGLCQQAVWNHQGNRMAFANGQLYEEAEGWHGGFRVADYPPNCLFSHAEVVTFLDTLPADKKWIGPESLAYVRRFFEQYPDGMICFG